MRPPKLLRVTTSEWILVVVSLGAIGSQAFVPRDLSQGEALMMASLEGEFVGYTISRVVAAVLLVISAVSLVLAARRRSLSSKAVRVWLGYVAWFVGNFVLNAIGRETPDGWMRPFYQPVVIAALLLTVPPDLPRAIRTAKLLLLAFVYAAIAGAIVAPEMAIAQNYHEGLIPGMDFRLYGVGGGASTLASCALMFLMVELAEPAAGKIRYVNLLAAAGVLVATQAKTAWMFALLAAWVTATALVEKRILGFRRARLLGPLQWVSLGIGLVAYATFTGSVANLLDFAPTEVATNLSTLTGRTWIWEVSFGIFLENPWFGYGPGLWADADFIGRYGVFAHSHNQLLQSLASAGIAGAAGLAAYLFVLIRRAVLAMEVTLAPVILLAWILFQGLTDVPLRSDFLLDPFFLVHGVMLMMVLAGTAVLSSRGERRLAWFTRESGHHRIRSESMIPANPERPGRWRGGVE